MTTATFLFHGELNDFLPSSRRALKFAVACAPDATLKHMIEALGVPHTEVARIQVNDDDAELGRRLGDGDCVEVHPFSAMLPCRRVDDEIP